MGRTCGEPNEPELATAHGLCHRSCSGTLYLFGGMRANFTRKVPYQRHPKLGGLCAL